MYFGRLGACARNLVVSSGLLGTLLVIGGTAGADCISEIRDAKRLGREGGRAFCQQVEKNFANEVVYFARSYSESLCEVAQVIVCKAAFADATKSRSLCRYLIRTNWYSEEQEYYTRDLYAEVQKGLCNIEE